MCGGPDIGDEGIRRAFASPIGSPPLRELATTLAAIKQEGGSSALQVYIRNMRVPLLARARQVVQLSGPNAAEK